MISIKQIMPIEHPEQFKMHIAKYNGNSNPLDDYIENFEHWLSWNRWRGEGNKNRFNRQYVISFMDFYPQRGVFLFGGMFEILKTYSDHYEIRLLDEYSEFIGRLKVTNIHTPRGSSFKLENFYDNIEVTEILDKAYSNHIFPGYENVNYDFKTMKIIFRNDAMDWKSALENVKGVYMLTDLNSGKRYIGSAYGEYGVWSRWRQYCENGHGGNDQLMKLVKNKGYEYVENNFRFTLLEIHPKFTPDTYIEIRESYWKVVMLSRDEKFGYNSN